MAEQVVRRLLAEGMSGDVLQRLADGAVEQLAAEGGDVDTVQRLLAEGADADELLGRVAWGAPVEMVQLLVERVRDINLRDEHGHTVLQDVVVSRDSADIVRIILARPGRGRAPG